MQHSFGVCSSRSHMQHHGADLEAVRRHVRKLRQERHVPGHLLHGWQRVQIRDAVVMALPDPGSCADIDRWGMLALPRNLQSTIELLSCRSTCAEQLLSLECMAACLSLSAAPSAQARVMQHMCTPSSLEELRLLAAACFTLSVAP